MIRPAAWGAVVVVAALAAGCAPPRIAYVDDVVTVRGLDVERGIDLEVAVEGSTTPMLGTADGLVFRPRFPLRPGLAYRVTYGEWSGTLTLPSPDPGPATRVTGVFPSADVLPENQLKFYLEFSAPMGLGEAAARVKLVDDATDEVVELPFLELDEELWDPDQRRLTLFIDPGRIKHGVRPLAEVGPALVTGRRYRLAIDPAWRDANGRPLGRGFEKRFAVGPADDVPVDPASWRVEPPPAGSRRPLVVTFPEPLDYGLMQRVIRVHDAAGEIGGEVVPGAGERSWRFTPDDPWSAGSHDLVVDRVLEDLAGNSVGRPFQVPIIDGADPVGEWQTPRLVRVPFVIE